MRRSLRCEGFLKDYCSSNRQEIHVLISALKEGVISELEGSQGGLPLQMAIARGAKRLQDNLAFSKEAARWAFESWAIALGLSGANTEEGSGPSNLMENPDLLQVTADVPESQSKGERGTSFGPTLAMNANRTLDDSRTLENRDVGSKGQKPPLKRTSPLSKEIKRSAEIVRCPHCGLINPDSAKRCDCGYVLRGTPVPGKTDSQKQNVQSTVNRFLGRCRKH